MDFFSAISLDNLVTADFNAITFSLLGMGLVFSGLLIISLYIILLPKILRIPSVSLPQKDTTAQQRTDHKDQQGQQQEILLAIATALYLHQDFPEEQERITFKSHGDLDSPWKISGRVRGLSMRNPSSLRKGQRR